ncbi:MAG: MMPL family transporter [Candidatus Marinimicrobia bacterium]|nr:MMPL family transporter [Candidatus Neomarinimicrobiota bacterium]
MKHAVRQWFIRQATEYPKRTIIINILVTVLFAFGLPNLIIDDDFMKLLPPEMESRQTWDNIREEFGNTEIVYVALGKKGESIYNADLLRSSWDIAEALELDPNIDEVMSLSTMNRMDSDDGFMEVSDLQPARDLYPDELEEMKTYLDKNPDMKIRFISKNEDYINIIVRPVTDVPQDVVNKIIVKTVNENTNGFDVKFGGHAYITGTMPELIREDVMVLMRYGLVIMIIILLINLRSVPGVFMVLSVIFMSLVAMMGSLGWIYRFTGSDKFVFSVLNSSMPIILLTIANSDGVHFLTKFFKEMRKHKNAHDAVKKTMDSLFIPIFLTSITTVAAFMTLISAPIVQLTGYGISIGIGIAWAWFLSSSMLPAMVYLKKWNMESKAIAHMSIFEKFVDKFGFQVLRFPKRILALGLIIVAIGLYGMTLLKVDVNIASFFKPGTEIRDSFDFMDSEMAGTFDILARVEGDMKDPVLLNEMVNLQDYLEKVEYVTTSISIADVIKQMHRTVMDDDPLFETIPDSSGKVNNLFTLYSMSGDPDDFSSMVDYEYETGLITALMRNINASEIVVLVKDIGNYVEQNMRHADSITISGILVIFRDLIYAVIKSSAISIIVSIIIIALIVGSFFKSWKYGLLSVIPLTAAVILNFGFMGLFGVGLSHVTVLLSSIIIGVGVDFAVHYISQFRQIARNGTPSTELSHDVMEDVGYPIILDAASNMGFAALLFSLFLPIQYIGGLMVFAMVSTSVGTLTILAAALELAKNRILISNK